MGKNFVEVIFAANTSNLQRAMKDLDKTTGSVGNKVAGKWGKFGKLAAGGFAIAGTAALAFGKQAIQMASDANEVQSKLEVVYGKSLPGLISNLDTFSKATGTSRYELRQQAADMGALLQPMLGSREATAQMSEKIVKLATDLGSFNNIPTADALEKLRSGLVGEAEPLRSLGVLINDAAVKQEAYTSGIAKQGSELTEAQKVQARYNLIMKQTQNAQGDAERTSGSFANQMKRLKSQFNDTMTDIGVKLIPAFTDALKIANKAMEGFTAGVGLLSDAFKGLGDVLGDIKGTLSDLFNGPSESTEKLVNQTKQALKQIQEELRKTTRVTTQEARETVTALRSIDKGVRTDNLSNSLDTIMTKIDTLGSVAYEKGRNIGSNIGIGFIRGIQAQTPGIGAAGGAAVQAAFGGAKREAEIKSPSKLFEREIGGPIVEGMIRGIAKLSPKLARQLGKTVQEGLQGARSNLNNLGSGLAGMLGEGIDADSERKIADLQNSPAAQQLAAIEKAQDAEEKAKQYSDIQGRIATARKENNAEALADAQAELYKWTVDQEAQRLRESLTQQEQNIRDEADKRKRAAEQGITDLTDNLNRGLIKQKDFNDGLQKILSDSGVTYEQIGTDLGSAFANGFLDQMIALTQQMQMIFGKGSGNDFGIVNPLDAANEQNRAAWAKSVETWKERGEKLRELLKNARDKATEKSSPGGVKITSAEQALINSRTQDLKTYIAAGAPKAPAPISFSINVNSLDPKQASQAVIDAIKAYVRVNGPIPGIAA